MPTKKLNFSFEAKSAFDYQLLAGIASLALMSSIFVGADFTRPAQVISLLASNIFAFTVLFLIVWSTKQIVLAWKVERLSLFAVVLFGALIGMGKGALTGIGMVWAGVEPGLLFSISSRVWQTLMIGILLVPAAAFLSNLRFRFNEERQQLLSEKVRRDSSDSYYAESLVEIVANAKKKLRTAKSLAAKEQLADQIRNIVSQDLRPLSHQIWAREAARRPGYGFRSLLNEAVIREVYRPFLVPVLWLVTTFVPYILFFGFPDGAYLSGARAISLTVIFYLASLIKVPNLTLAWIKFGLVALLAIVMHQLLNEVVVGYPVFPIELIGIPISNLIWIVQLMLLSGIIRVFITRGKEIRSELRNLVEEGSSLEDWQKQALIKDRQLAQFLHGHLQSRLMATAIRLEQEKGVQTLPEDIDLVERVLEDSVARFISPRSKTLDDLKEELNKSWSGLIDLELNFMVDQLAPSTVNTLSELIDEGITNALRHGFAHKVRVELFRESGNLVLTIADDGTGPRSGPKGLGSYFFDSVALDWRLDRGAVGSVLRVVFAG